MMEAAVDGQQIEAKSYGLPERCAMLALMALGREAYNSDLKKQYGLDIKKPHRERLNRDGLIASRKDGGRGFVHELTDKGWAWAASELGAGVPPRAGSAGGALYALLNGLAKVLERRGWILAELFGEMHPQEDVNRRVPGDNVALSSQPLRERIRTAYKRLAKRPRDWVYLSDLHAHLNGATKAEIDSTLREMFRAREVSLTLEEDQASLTKKQRSAALRLGTDDMHLLSME